MKKNSLKYLLYAVLILLMGVALISCGSSSDDSNGGGTTGTPGSAAVTGVAATGSPMSGEVMLKDSTGTEIGPAVIAPNGTFSFDVTGLTPPYYLRAESTTGEVLYSVAMDAGTANINPLTNLAVAEAAGVSDPKLVYDDPLSYPITQAALDQAIADILANLDPFFEQKKYDCKGQNPLTDHFEADHKGLDKFFDDVAIELVGGVVTFTDKDSGHAICKMSVPGMHVTDPLISVEGDGSNLFLLLSLDVNELSLPEGDVNGTYIDESLKEFTSTSITGVNVQGNNDIVITGLAKCAKGTCTFTVTLTDDDPDNDDDNDLVSLDIDSVNVYSDEEITTGNFTVKYLIAN